MIMDHGRIAAIGRTEEILGDSARLSALGLTHPPPRRAEDGPAPDAGNTLLELEGVTFAHDPDSGHERVDVWRGLDLGLAQGEVLALAGRNGAGKTTLAKLLGGLLEPQSGTIRLYEAGASGSGSVAVVLHTPSVFFSEASLRTEIERSLAAGGIRSDAIQARIAEIARQLGLEDILDTDPGLLPPGSARIAQTAAMMARGAPVLVLDEVAPGLDPRERARLASVIADFAASGGGVVVLDHDLDFLAASATRVCLIEGGTVHDAGTPGAAFAPANAARLRALDLDPPSTPPPDAGAPRTERSSG